MKRYGDNAPGTYSIEEQPKNPGYVLVRFFENAAPFTRTDGDREHSGYEYDEYTLELLNYDGLMDDIASNLEVYLEQAKAQEEQNKSPDEKIAKVKQDVDATTLVSDIVFVTLAESGAIDDVTAGEHAALFGEWTYPVYYKEGSMRVDPLDGCLYRVNTGQAHTSQQGWNPSLTPALWSKAADPAEEWPAWSQPLGAHDSYDFGAKVSHNDKHWISNMNGNSFEPGIAGWDEVAE